MKLCPTCNRTYADEALTFCLDDGSTLSAFYDPHVAQRISPPRNTDQVTPRSPTGEFTNKSEDTETRTQADPFLSVNSIPISVDHSKGGGASIQTRERSSDGTWHVIVGDSFPPPRKSKLLLIAAVSCILVLLALIGAAVLWFVLR